jgi:uncharacterized protein (DUF1810 family)
MCKIKGGASWPPFPMSNDRAENDKFNLERFVLAQRNTYVRALTEIKHGQKSSHWMWFIFPQLKGLGRSYESQLYGISGLDEARAYLSHKILGNRLKECVSSLLTVENQSAREIFGSVDEMKLRSSLTLFKVALTEPIFDEALSKFFDGKLDDATLKLLELHN